MKTKLVVALLLGITILTGCGKKSGIYAVPDDYTITLDSVVKTANGVKLKWTMSEGSDFRYITIYKYTDSTSTSAGGVQLANGSTAYTDTLTWAPYVQYSVKAYSEVLRKYIESNKIVFVRNDIEFLKWAPQKAIIDHETHLIYMFSKNGDIALYDIKRKQITKEVATGATFLYPSVGTYNTKKELYVARNDGWLFIYDAATLDVVGQINMGWYSTSVVSNNGKLFVTNESSQHSIAVFDRATGTKLEDTTTYTNYGSNMKMLPGTNTSIIGINSSYYFNRIDFDNNGNLLTVVNKPGSGANAAQIFEVFPDGQKFITSTSGYIYDKDLVYISSLPRGTLNFGSFDFDNVNRRIYASCDIKQVNVYSMDNFLSVSTLATKGYPSRVFYDDGSVIAISTNAPATGYYYSSQTPIAIIETL